MHRLLVTFCMTMMCFSCGEKADESNRRSELPAVPNENTETEEELLRRTHETYIQEDCLTITEDGGIKIFTLDKPLESWFFKHLQAINIHSKELRKLKINRRDIYIQASTDENKLLNPAIQLDRNYEELSLVPFTTLKFDGEKILKLIELDKKFHHADSKRFMLRILLTDGTLPDDPIRAIILLPIQTR